MVKEVTNRLENKSYQLTGDLSTFIKMFKEKERVVIYTCHGVKGEGYQTVIAFGLVYGKIPSVYLESDKRDEEVNKLLYIIVSRAKNRWYFLEKGREYCDDNILMHFQLDNYFKVEMLSMIYCYG